VYGLPAPPLAFAASEDVTSRARTPVSFHVHVVGSVDQHLSHPPERPFCVWSG
jgi:hypothetical protein